MLQLRIDKTIRAGQIAFGRVCNLRCVWCHHDYFEHHGTSPAQDNTALVTMVKRIIAATGNQTTHVRIAGNGEPTLVGKHELVTLVRMLKEVPEIHRVELTTNGILLSTMAEQLLKAGLDQVTISLNTLNRTTYKKYMGRDLLHKVLDSIAAAHEIGLELKVNTIFGKFNQDEVLDFVDLSRRYQGVPVKFFDLLITSSIAREEYLSLDHLEQKLQQLGAQIEETSFPYAKRIYRLHSGALIEVKVAGKINTCPNLNCLERANCLEGCRSSIRIGLDGEVAPCGIRYDNRFNLISGNIDDETIRRALFSGGKLTSLNTLF